LHKKRRDDVRKESSSKMLEELKSTFAHAKKETEKQEQEEENAKVLQDLNNNDDLEIDAQELNLNL